MCYGDIDHGKDGYYRSWAEEMDRLAYDRQYEQEPQQEPQQEPE